MADDDDERVHAWDEHGKEIRPQDLQCCKSWWQCKNEKRFPNGLIDFMETPEPEGCSFQSPTPIQSYSFPVLLSGKDFVGIAKTGSGKTLAFLLPGFIWLKKAKKKGIVDTKSGPAMLIITPTRELCFQIYSDTEKFGSPVGLTAACAYGGASAQDQEWKIKEGPDSLAATPGRLKDFADKGKVDLTQSKYVVIDEADQMLDLGFEPQIKGILDFVPAQRQISMFTATWSKGVRGIADKYITKAIHVQIGSDEISTNKNISQYVEITDDENDKMGTLQKIIDYLGDAGGCMVFCNGKRTCIDLAWKIEEAIGSGVVQLHGDLDQWKRDEAMQKFKNGEARVMVATDVASRGLDIRRISTVVNWDAPENEEVYVHRIGRTGRAFDTGDAYTFLKTWGEEKKAKAIVGIMERAGQEVPEELRELAAKADEGGDSWGGDDKWNKPKEEKSWGKDDSWNKQEKSWPEEKSWGKEEKSWDKKADAWNKKEDTSWSSSSGQQWKKEEKQEKSWGSSSNGKPKGSIGTVFTKKPIQEEETWEEEAADDAGADEEWQEESSTGGAGFGELGSALGLLGKRGFGGDDGSAKRSRY